MPEPNNRAESTLTERPSRVSSCRSFTIRRSKWVDRDVLPCSKVNVKGRAKLT